MAYTSDTPLKILQLSDVHLGAVYQKPFVKTIVSKILDNEPDIVVITGDFFDDSLEVKESWLEPFMKVQVPILFTSGNHDCYYQKEDVVAITNTANIIYLNKDVYEYKGVRFVGVDYDEDLDKTLDNLKNEGKLGDDMPNVLLLHAPKKPSKFKKYNIFLTLSGHTHDGQIFPGNVFGRLMFDCMNGVCSSDDNYIYVSNRGEETIARIEYKDKLKLNSSLNVYGNHSRHMIFDETKNYIISFNKISNNISIIDKLTNELIMNIPYNNCSCGVVI